MAKELTGGCACGSIRYQLLDKPMFVHCCHCDDCQRSTGSAFVLNAIIETQAIKLLRGEMNVVVAALRGLVYQEGDRGLGARVMLGLRAGSPFVHTPFDAKEA